MADYNKTTVNNSETHFENSTREIQNNLMEEPYPKTLFKQKLDTIEREKDTNGLNNNNQAAATTHTGLATARSESANR